jgi:hypothetical protein
MPHYKCVTCTTRLVTGGRPGSCEGCGSVLEPVGALSEVVGYRLVQPRDERFEAAVAMALQGMDTAGPGRHDDGRTR